MPDGRAWSERLEQILGASRFAVINHGSAWYSSVELVLQTAFYEEAFGVKPDCAVYRLGGVDLQNAHFRDVDPGYADYHTPSLIDSFSARRVDRTVPPISPTFHYLGRLTVLAFDTLRPATLPPGKVSGRPDPNLEAVFARNIRTISAINRQRGITTIWVGEMVDLATLQAKGPKAEPWTPYLPGEAGWSFLSRLNNVLKREAVVLGDVHIDTPVRDFTPSDFIDEDHFSAAGSQKFAALVAPQIAQACHRS